MQMLNFGKINSSFLSHLSWVIPKVYIKLIDRDLGFYHFLRLNRKISYKFRVINVRILVVTQYFWPETFIINDLVQCLCADGHFVEVLTGKPNYPDGDIYKNYTASGSTSDLFMGKIPVHRIPVLARGRGGKRLLLNYVSYVLSAFFYFPKFVKGKKFDVIFVFVPSPITSAIPAMYLKRRLGSHLAVWVQDFWPESVQATGFIKSRFLLGIIGRLVKWIYSVSDTLLVQSQAFAGYIKKYACEDKIVFYPNSVLEKFNDADENILIPPDLLNELVQNQCFVFAGNLGSAQSLDTIVKAAERLKDLKNCKILLIGSGSKKDWVIQQIRDRDIKNILLPGRFPPSIMPLIFFHAAGLIVSLKKEEIFSYTVPSKVQAYLAAGRPILASLDGEGGRIVKEAGSGLVSPAEDYHALAKNIEQLYHMPVSEREKLGQSGRAYFLEHFEMKKQSQRLIEILTVRMRKKMEILK